MSYSRCFLQSNNWISRHKTALSNHVFVQLTDELLYPSFADVLFALAPLQKHLQTAQWLMSSR